MVLDNADDAAALSPPTSSSKDAPLHHLSAYLPPSRCGSVLVTSRTKHAASRLVEASDMIHIEPMHDAGAQALLHKKLGDEVNKDGIAELATALEYMPLALVQAAAYIQKRAPDYSVQRYLEEFRRSNRRKTSLPDQEEGHLRRDGEAENSIITWQISFEHIQSTRRSAANLLSLMSFFDRQGIPKALLRDPGVTRIVHETQGQRTKRKETVTRRTALRKSAPTTGLKMMFSHYETTHSFLSRRMRTRWRCTAWCSWRRKSGSKARNKRKNGGSSSSRASTQRFR